MIETTDKSEDVEGNYPNSEGETSIDAEKQMDMIRARRARFLEYHEPTVATDAYTPKKTDTDADGDRREYSLEDVSLIEKDSYPFTDQSPKKKQEKGSDNSGQPKSPLN